MLYRHAHSKSGRKPGSKRQKKADARFERGIMLGKSNESDEFLIGTDESGIMTARTVRRLEQTKQLDRGLMHRFIGVPWDLTMGRRIHGGTTPRICAWSPRSTTT